MFSGNDTWCKHSPNMPINILWSWLPPIQHSDNTNAYSTQREFIYLSRVNIEFMSNLCFAYVRVNCGVGIHNSNSCSLFLEGLKSLLFYITPIKQSGTFHFPRLSRIPTSALYTSVVVHCFVSVLLSFWLSICIPSGFSFLFHKN